MILATLTLAAYAFCEPGYARAHRPPYAVTHAIKLNRLHGRQARDYELDHIVPLELGGCPTCPTNLQLQPWPEAIRKDRDENRLHRAVCSGHMSLPEAQREMRAWKP
jgi:hypothetical protein